MAFLVTREDLRQRLRDEVKYCSTAGAGADADLNRRLQREVNRVWERMTATAQNVGQATLSKTIAVAEPDGYVPGARVPLPADFRRAVQLLVDGQPPELRTAAKVEYLAESGVAAVGSVGHVYYFDGPSQDTSGPTPVPTDQQIRLFPDWTAGQSLVLVYAVQPPTLGDPADAGDDGIELDLVHEPAVRLVVARACVRSVSREDQQGYLRAKDEQAEAEEEFTRALARREAGALPLASFRNRGRR